MSLSREARDERIAEIERLRVVATTSGTWSRWEIGDAIVNQLPWLIAELRASLAREAEATKASDEDGEKLVAVEVALMALEASHGLDLSHCTSYADEITAIGEQLDAHSESIRNLAEQVFATEERLAEATKDAERLARGLTDALRLIDAASPFAWHNGNTHNGIDEGDVLTGRFLESIRSALPQEKKP